MATRLSASYQVSPQIQVADVAAIAEQGCAVLINNRPDGEEPLQPKAQDIKAACEAAGMAYVAIPIGPMGLTQEHVAQTLAAMADAEAAGGGVFAFCRSGTRSANIWALARAAAGDNAEDLLAAAREGGYDLSPLRPTLIALKDRNR